MGIVFVWEPSPVFGLDNLSVFASFGQRADGGIFELTGNGHGVIDDDALVSRHPKTALVVSTWAVIVLPKIEDGALHRGGFGIVVMFDRGCDGGAR